jgi:hypothetical protein
MSVCKSRSKGNELGCFIGRNLSWNLAISGISKSINICVAELDDACVFPERLSMY